MAYLDKKKKWWKEFDVVMHILIVKTLTHFYMDMHYCPWHLRKPQIQNINYMNFIEQPNNKGAYSYKVKISKIGNSPVRCM